MDVILDARQGGARLRLLGITLSERLLRQLARLTDVGRVEVVVNDDGGDAASAHRPNRARPALAVVVRRRDQVKLGEGLCLTLAGDALIDSRVMRALLARHEPAWVATDGRAVAAVLPREQAASLLDGRAPDAIAALALTAIDPYVASMRRTIPVHVLAAPHDAAGLAHARSVLLDASQNGALDLPARWIHRPIELALAPVVAELEVSPNQLTALSGVLGIAATTAILFGWVPLGIALALGYGILDGLDGKQARLKVETSRLGELEHLADYAIETSWWLALAYHLHRGGDATALRAAFLLVVGDVLTRWGSGYFRRRTGKLLDDWSPWDRAARAVAGRRNINIWVFAMGLAIAVPLATLYRALALWSVATATHRWVRIAVVLRSFTGARQGPSTPEPSASIAP